MQAMDAAFAFYDDEKVRRSAAYDAYEKSRERVSKSGDPAAPIELS